MVKITLQNLRVAVVQPKRKRVRDGYTKVGKLVTGTVIEDEDGNYMVSIDSDGNGIGDELILPFTPRSFDIVGLENVFTRNKDENGHRIRVIRDKFKAKTMPGLQSQYTPFTKNWTVKGYIVREGIVKMFDFKYLVGINGYNIKSMGIIQKEE